MEFVIHQNKCSWVTVWHIITNDGMGHIAVNIEDENPETLFIYGLSVYEGARNRRLGTMLLNKAESIADNKGVTRLMLNVEKPKTWVYDFYIRGGYELWDEDETYFYLVKYV